MIVMRHILAAVAVLALAGCQYNGVVDVGQAERVIITIDRTTQDRGRQSGDIAREAEVGITEGL